MKSFKKYEFSSQEEWATYQALIQQTNAMPDGAESKSYIDCSVVEIGNIVITPAVMGEAFEIKTPAVLSDKWAVDILWYEEPKSEFTPFEVWPKPCGVHTFSGHESVYLQAFCEKFPDSPFCAVSEPVVE